MMDRIEALALFARSVERGSLAAAARDLALSTSAATRMLAALEKRVGARLLLRSTRRLAPTEAGRALYPRAKRLVAELEEAEQAAASLTASPRGTLVLSLPVLFGRLEMGPVLAGYLQRWPETGIEARYADRAIDLIEDGVDCAIRIGTLPDSTLVARRLGSFRRLVVAAPAYIARAGRPRTPADLAAHEAVLFSALGDVWPLQDGPIRMTGRITAQDGGAVLDLARHGLGLALVPDWQAAADLATGRLVSVLPDHRTPPVPVHAVFPEARLLSAKVRAFVDLCILQFAGGARTEGGQAHGLSGSAALRPRASPAGGA